LDASGFDAFAGTAPALRPTRGKTQRKDRTAELKARLRDIKQREKEQAATVRAAEREQAEAEAAAAKAQARTQAERTGADAVAQERKAIERELQDAREDRSARAKHDVVHGD
jgi:plasmid replication initiation protein